MMMGTHASPRPIFGSRESGSHKSYPILDRSATLPYAGLNGSRTRSLEAIIRCTIFETVGRIPHAMARVGFPSALGIETGRPRTAPAVHATAITRQPLENLCRETARSNVGRGPRCAREPEGLAERHEKLVDRSEFARCRTVGICRGGRRSVAVQATLEHRSRFGFGEMPAIQEQVVRIVRNFAAGRYPRDGHALQSDKSQRVLCAVGEESVPVPDGDEPHGAVRLLEGRDLTKHFKFTRAFPDRIARRPRRSPQDRDRIARGLGNGDRVKECGQSTPNPRSDHR